jgi:IS5 family transposase
MFQIWHFSKNKNSKRKDRCIKKMKIYLGRLIRNFESQITKKSIKLSHESEILVSKIKKIHTQSALKKNELATYKKTEKYIYSLHAPEVECIVKGKLNKSAEFGNKVSIAITGDNNFIIGIKSFHNNPYDGHTLSQTIETIRKISPQSPKNIYVDMGYQGHNWQKKDQVYHRKCKKILTKENKRMLKRRNAIEPIIGHLKTYGRLACNRLKGFLGDILNPILSAVGFNLKAIVNFLQQTG